MWRKRQHRVSRSSEKSALLAPSIEALLIQITALLLVWAMVQALDSFAHIALPIFACAILQGAVAALLTVWRQLARWWIFIQFFFPILIIAAQALHLPSWLFLAAFIISVAVYWSTFRTQVPFFPSSPSTWNAIAALLPAQRALRFVDIGSGFGGLVLHLSALRPESHFCGVEIAPLPWLASVIRTTLKGSRGRFSRTDYKKLNFAAYDVVFAYLSPAAMPALWKKARAEMRSGTLLLSYEFSIPDVEPQIISLPDKNGASLYGWNM